MKVYYLYKALHRYEFSHRYEEFQSKKIFPCDAKKIASRKFRGEDNTRRIVAYTQFADGSLRIQGLANEELRERNFVGEDLRRRSIRRRRFA